MKKSLFIFTLVLALIVVQTIPSTSADSVQSTFELKLVREYMPRFTPINGTSYVLCTEKFTHYQTLYNTAGEQLCTFPFTNVNYVNYGLLTAYSGTDVNNRALVHVNGAQVTDAAYGDIKVYSKNWAAGYVLEPAAEESFNYKLSNQFFNVERVDLFYIADEPVRTEPVGSLSFDEFKNAAAHGEYLAVQDQEDQVTLYDQAFRKVDFEMKGIGNSVYGVVDFALVNMTNNEMIQEGYTAAREQNTANGLWLTVTRTDLQGVQKSGILTTKGETILPVEYTINTVTEHYVILNDAEKRKGLYSLDEDKLLVPCEYFNIMAFNTTTDKYVAHGYVAVEDGDLRGYYDVNAGRLSCEIKYDRNTVTTVGCSTFWQVEEGLYRIAAADGVETDVRVDEIVKGTRGDGYWLVAKRDGMFGIIDWHGNVVMPFDHKNTITLTDDSQAMLRTSTGMQMDVITR